MIHLNIAASFIRGGGKNVLLTVRNSNMCRLRAEGRFLGYGGSTAICARGLKGEEFLHLLKDNLLLTDDTTSRIYSYYFKAYNLMLDLYLFIYLWSILRGCQ
jgi:hypothetical protein